MTTPTQKEINILSIISTPRTAVQINKILDSTYSNTLRSLKKLRDNDLVDQNTEKVWSLTPVGEKVLEQFLYGLEEEEEPLQWITPLNEAIEQALKAYPMLRDILSRILKGEKLSTTEEERLTYLKLHLCMQAGKDNIEILRQFAYILLEFPDEMEKEKPQPVEEEKPRPKTDEELDEEWKEKWRAENIAMGRDPEHGLEKPKRTIWRDGKFVEE